MIDAEKAHGTTMTITRMCRLLGGCPYVVCQAAGMSVLLGGV